MSGMVRTPRFSLEEKLKTKLAVDSPEILWLVRHAGHLITKCWVRSSGKTAYEMIKGRTSNAKLVAFGEAVLFRVPNTKTKPG